MSDGKRKSITVFSAVLLLIAFAAACHALTRSINADFPSILLNFTRTFIYIGAFTAWGISVSKRIIHKPVRRILTAVAVLAVFWITVREIKFRFAMSQFVIRLLWYSYYIPHLVIPVLAVIVSLYIGRSEDYRIGKRTVLPFIPSAVLSALIMTNDLHQWCFVFPEGSEVWSERDYSYGPVFYAASAWIIICAVASLVILIIKSRNPQSRRLFWIPLLPFGLSIIHLTMYSMKLPIISYVDDIAVFLCLMYISYFELCIQCGLIQSNMRYSELFSASLDVPALIVNRAYDTVYHTEAEIGCSREDMKKAELAPVILHGGKRLHNIPVSGGHAIWSEDISEILSLNEELEFRHEELKVRNALLEDEYVKEAEHKRIEEQNRLYELLESETENQLDEINRLVRLYKTQTSVSDKKKTLAKIVFIGSCIKRRKDLVLSSSLAKEGLSERLESALGESYRSLKLSDIGGSFIVDAGEEGFRDISQVKAAYGFFEEAALGVIGKAHYLNTSVSRVGSVLRISILTDCTDSFSYLKARYPSCAAEYEDDSAQLLLPLEGGESL